MNYYLQHIIHMYSRIDFPITTTDRLETGKQTFQHFKNKWARYLLWLIRTATYVYLIISFIRILGITRYTKFDQDCGISLKTCVVLYAWKTTYNASSFACFSLPICLGIHRFWIRYISNDVQILPDVPNRFTPKLI